MLPAIAATGLRDTPRYLILGASTGALWLEMSLQYVTLYLGLMATHQMGVGVCRLFGYNVNDDYRSPLLAQNLVDHWRRWNCLWRDALTSAVYYPMALWLSRSYRLESVSIHFISGWTTFMVSGVFHILPVVLFFVPSFFADTPERGAVSSRAVRELSAIFVPAFLLYFCSMGILVGAGLALEARRRCRPRKTRRQTLLRKLAATGFTFAVMAYMRSLPLFFRYPALAFRAFGW